MAKYSRLTVLNTMFETGIVPVFYHPDVEVAARIVQACLDGGVRCVEFTNRGDQAHLVFGELVRRFYDDDRAILGVGSVIDPAAAGLYIQLGANFVVGPVLNPEVARLCNRRKVAYSPGCGSASEISEAEELGVEIVKVFPGSQLGGPGFVKAIKAPCPWAKVMPTGGVDATWENLKGWFDAGVTCVGMGSKLVRKDLVAAEDWAGLTALTAQCLAWIRKARGEGLYRGVEHPGLYPTADASAEDIVAWYQRAFDFQIKEGRSSFFLSGDGPGRIEVLKTEGDRPCHVAVLVSDFEAAVEDLRAKGIDLEEPKIKPTVKSVYLKEPDPAGNAVHLLWVA